ncbi:MAG: CPBP family glutamic-type intramembrane protease [Candidatus Nitrosocosmicus sp.]
MFKQFDFKDYIDSLNKAVTFYLFLFITASIFFGLYLVFFTDIGKDIGWHDNVPLTLLLLSVFNLSSLYSNLGLSFLFFWFFYAMLYLFVVFKPVFLFRGFGCKKFFNRDLKIFGISISNYLYIAIQWFSAYFVLSIVIDWIQQLFEISIGDPLLDNPLLSFFYITAAPLNEEILFRIIFLGVPLSLVLVRYKSSLISTLVHPGRNVSVESNGVKTLVFLIIFLNSAFFGLSHVVFGGDYGIGKITQATMGGLFLGWLYYKYGIVTSIIFHWISNYVLFSYGLVGFYFFNTSLSDETNNYFLMVISVAFIIVGIISMFRGAEKTFMFAKKR